MLRNSGQNQVASDFCKRCDLLYPHTTLIGGFCSHCRTILAGHKAWSTRTGQAFDIEQHIADRKRREEQDARTRARRAKQIQLATPKWADKTEIQKIYRQARDKSKKGRIQYAVDHVIPLIHSKVCGLHVQDNLQILTLSQNAKKRNKFKVG